MPKLSVGFQHLTIGLLLTVDIGSSQLDLHITFVCSYMLLFAYISIVFEQWIGVFDHI